jgi:broad specificity phosphatase PhoE
MTGDGATNTSETRATLGTQAKKTLYLIRHAESEENRRLASLGHVGTSLTRFSLPQSSDIWASFGLLNVPAQVDSPVSDIGKAQIMNVAAQIKAANFWQTHKVTLVAHSPLQRAEETCRGLLGNAAEAAADSESNPMRIVSIDVLREKTPAEWLPGNSTSLKRRLDELESWLMAQPEDVICLVGHSQFFKNLLNLSYKFANVDVYKVEFDPSVAKKRLESLDWPPKDTLPLHYSGLERIFQCKPETEKKEVDKTTTVSTANSSMED